jgi:hypothetical protein
MNIHLVVVHPFAEYIRGQIITDAATITQILASEHAIAVVRVLNTAEKGN